MILDLSSWALSPKSTPVLPGFGSLWLPLLSFALVELAFLHIHMGHFLLETGSSNTKEMDTCLALPLVTG